MEGPESDSGTSAAFTSGFTVAPALKKVKRVACFFSMVVAAKKTITKMLTLYRRSLSTIVGRRLLSRSTELQTMRFSGSRCFSGEAKPENPVSTDGAEAQSEENLADKPVPEGTVDEYTKAAEGLTKAETSLKELHHKLLLKYADAENKRRERVEELKKRDAVYVKKMGEKTVEIYESLKGVCQLAQKKAANKTADDKVKSLSEGLVMTHGLMKNILSKHNVVIKESK